MIRPGRPAQSPSRAYRNPWVIFNLGCRASVGKPGGEKANGLTWVRDLANGC